MPQLKSHHFDLLDHLAKRRGAVPLSELDRRQLRPLLTLRLVSELGGRVSLTPEGDRLRVERPPAGASLASPTRTVASRTAHAPRWEDVLRMLIRQPGAVPADHIDGRSAQALLGRGYIRISANDWVSPTAEGRAYIQGTGPRAENDGRGRRRNTAPGGGRGQALLRAIEMLEASVPVGAELLLGEMPAYADDVFAALREVARQLAGK